MLKRACLFFLLLWTMADVVACRDSKLPVAATPTRFSPPDARQVAQPIASPSPESIERTATRAPAPPPSPSATATIAPSLIGAAGTGTHPNYPNMGNGGYEVEHVALDLTVSIAEKTLDAAAVIELQTTQGLRQFNFDFAGMEVDSVRIDGTPVRFTREPLELVIQLPQIKRSDDRLEVEIAYHGTPGTGEPNPITVPGFQKGWFFHKEGVYVISEPAGAASWYPANMDLHDRATYTYRITVEKPYVVAANGIQTDLIDNGETTTAIWEARDPLPAYLTTVAIGHFRRVDDVSQSGVPLRSFFAEGVPEEAVAAFRETDTMMETFATLFGPYPFEAYGVVLHNVQFLGGLEAQTLTTVGYEQANESLAAHELFHQWFGNSVLLESWQDLWLKEGLATYAAILWTEQSQGRDVAERQLRETLIRYLPLRTPRIVEPYAEPDGVSTAYVRGALTIHALRVKVGDQVFFSILRTYYNRFQGKNASTDDFIAVAEEVSGEPLDDFFYEWLFQKRVPEIPWQDQP